jgi:uncharacterized membrane protein YfcA
LRINPSVVRLVFGVFMLLAAGRLIVRSWHDLNA